jgi:hypothetical protein
MLLCPLHTQTSPNHAERLMVSALFYVIKMHYYIIHLFQFYMVYVDNFKVNRSTSSMWQESNRPSAISYSRILNLIKTSATYIKN